MYLVERLPILSSGVDISMLCTSNLVTSISAFDFVKLGREVDAMEH